MTAPHLVKPENSPRRALVCPPRGVKGKMSLGLWVKLRRENCLFSLDALTKNMLFFPKRFAILARCALVEKGLDRKAFLIGKTTYMISYFCA